MKKTALLLFGLNLLSISNRLFAQGSLTPPGAPGATMKTLTQIEPRTPISGVFNIAAPGSYYLTTNITLNLINQVGISINASGVTLDLNGFTIGSTADYSAVEGGGAIELGSGLSDITIRNGHLRGGIKYTSGTYSEFGFGDGINYSGTAPVNVQVSGVSVAGCLYYGINLGTGNSTVVDGCTVETAGSYGIEAASVLRSTAYQCGTAIVGKIAIDCYGYSTSGVGVNALQTAHNCYGVGDNDDGLDAANANNCYGFSGSSEGEGINVSQTANNCYGIAGSGTGLSATTANNCYGSCMDSPGTGLSATTATGCYGYNPGGGGTGVVAYIAIGCYGVCDGYGTGMSAHIANSCYSSTGDGEIVNKYNMP
jgi:hypothetical protein